ncbi:hypothetical protein HSX11_13665 [Oxalobacteraceae bacterium]|nr:hypothetical protein [Oxalobacteraceae bacterium]
MTSKDCSLCGRKGLLIYPVRYAVACPAGADGVPGLSGNFQIIDAPQNVGSAKYALRALRSGYLYSYDEKRDRLKAYVVMERGHLWNFPIHLPPPDLSQGGMVCINSVDIALSLCVDVTHSDIDPAGKIWLGWSSTTWTASLLKNAKDLKWRKKHMQCVDVPAMLAGGAAHTGEFQACHTGVSHFASELRGMHTAFGYSNAAVKHESRRRYWSAGIIKTMSEHSPHHKGYIVAVNDPVGITNDLSELTIPTRHSGFDEQVYRGKIIDDLLRSTEYSVRTHARAKFAEEHTVVADARTEVYNNPNRTWLGNLKDILRGDVYDYYQKQKKAERKMEESRLSRQKAAEDSAWRELTTIEGKPILDEQRRKEQPTLYEQAIKAFEPQALALSNAHFRWLTSAQLADWMEGVHDPADIRSGFAFRESLAQCLGKAVGTVLCSNQLKQWLNSTDISNTRNLYSRAMLFNQTEILSAAESQVGGGDIKAENLLNIYKGALERLTNGEESKLIDRLALTTTNILIYALHQSSTMAMRTLTLNSLSLLGKTLISPSKLHGDDIQGWAISQATAQGIQLDTNGTETKVATTKGAKKTIPRLPVDPSICAYELNIAQLERMKKIDSDTIKSVKLPGFESTKRWLASSPDFNLGVVGSIIQLAALYYAAKDYQGSDRFDQKKTGMIAAVSAVSLTAAIMETVTTSLENSPDHPLSAYLYKQWSLEKEFGKKATVVAKKIALAAGLVMAIFDVVAAWDARKEGEKTLAYLYFGNAILGGILAMASFSIGATFFWPAFFASLVLAIIISLVKKSALKKWLTHCHYANIDKNQLETNIYPTLEEELKTYQNAMGVA